MFQEKILNLVNKFVFPVLYKVFLAYYEPCLNLEKIKAIKEPLIIHLQEQIVNGQLAKMLRDLCRVSTFEQENILAEKVFNNRGRTLKQIGVDKIFLLNNHIRHIESSVYNPFQSIINLVKGLNSEEFLLRTTVQQMQHILKISRMIVEIIDVYYDESKPYKQRFGIDVTPEIGKKIDQELQAVNKDKLVLDADQLLMI